GGTSGHRRRGLSRLWPEPGHLARVPRALRADVQQAPTPLGATLACPSRDAVPQSVRHVHAAAPTSPRHGRSPHVAAHGRVDRARGTCPRMAAGDVAGGRHAGMRGLAAPGGIPGSRGVASRSGRGPPGGPRMSTRLHRNFASIALSNLLAPCFSLALVLAISRIQGVETLGKYSLMMTVFVVG